MEDEPSQTDSRLKPNSVSGATDRETIAVMGWARQPAWWSALSGCAIFLLAVYIAFFSEFSNALEANLRAENANLLQERIELLSEVRSLETEAERVRGLIAHVTEEVVSARAELATLSVDIEQDRAERDALAHEREALLNERRTLRAERDQLHASMQEIAVQGFASMLLGTEATAPWLHVSIDSITADDLPLQDTAGRYYDSFIDALTGSWGADGSEVRESARSVLLERFLRRCGDKSAFIAEVNRSITPEPPEVQAAREPLEPPTDTGDRQSDIRAYNEYIGERHRRAVTLLNYRTEQASLIRRAALALVNECLTGGG